MSRIIDEEKAVIIQHDIWEIFKAHGIDDDGGNMALILMHLHAVIIHSFLFRDQRETAIETIAGLIRDDLKTLDDISGEGGEFVTPEVK